MLHSECGLSVSTVYRSQGTRARLANSFAEVVVVWFSPSLHSLTVNEVGGALVRLLGLALRVMMYGIGLAI